MLAEGHAQPAVGVQMQLSEQEGRYHALQAAPRVSCAPYPVPCVLYHVSCALYPVPCALYHVSCALYPVPCALCPVPCVLRSVSTH